MSDLKSCRYISAKISGHWQWLALGLAILFLSLPLFSQSSQGTIQGGIFDQTGGAVAGAIVSVIDVARGVTRTLTADGAGQYVANDLTPGTYTVRAEAKGFQTVEHPGVLVEVGQNIRVDLVVQPGEQTQTVTVTGELPAIDTTDATLGGTVSNAEINALPLNGRNFDRLLQLRPGVVSSVGGGNAAGPQTNGRRNTDNQLRVDGIAGMAQAQGSDILNATYRTGDADSLMPIDAIQEFNTEQNPKAEYGFRDGAIVNVGVKSGTNSIHGTAYAFGRDAAATDSANYFTGVVNPATLEQFGATAGGPIIKDKLFWFAGFEGLRLSTGDPSQVTIPVDVGTGVTPATLAAAQARAPIWSTYVIFSNSPRMAVSVRSAHNWRVWGTSPRAAPAVVQLRLASPSFENVFPFSTTGQLNPPLVTTGPLNNGLFKGDYVINSHHHVGGMYFVSKSNAQANSQAQQIEPQWETIAVNDVQQIDGSWTWTPNSILVNDFRAGLCLHEQRDRVRGPEHARKCALADRLRNQYGRDESPVRRVPLCHDQQSRHNGIRGWAAVVDPRAGRRCRFRGERLVFARQAHIQIRLRVCRCDFGREHLYRSSGCCHFPVLGNLRGGLAAYRLDLDRRSHGGGSQSLVRIVRAGRLAHRSQGDLEPGIALGVLTALRRSAATTMEISIPT